MNSEELTKNADLQNIATQGVAIYQELKGQFEPAEKGKFLAIDIESKNTYVATTRAEAVVKARVEHPAQVFYVVKIGFEAVETIAHRFTKK